MNEKDFAVIIRKKREKMKLTQQEAAALCGIGERTLQNVEYKCDENSSLASASVVFSTYFAIAKVLGLKFTLTEKKRQRAKSKA